MTAPSSITCAQVERDELERRYVASLLTDDEADAFEAHYFACERCWAALQRAVELRAALDAEQVGRLAFVADSSGPAPLTRDAVVTSAAAPGRRRVARWWPVALGAAAALVIVASWPTIANHVATTGAPNIAPDNDAMRGESAALPLGAAAVDGDLTVSWPRVSGADSYRVRLFGADGALLLERVIDDTTFAVAVKSLDTAAGHPPFFWDVQARDRLHRVMSRSALTASPVPEAP